GRPQDPRRARGLRPHRVHRAGRGRPRRPARGQEPGRGLSTRHDPARPAVCTERTPRVAAARQLARRAGRTRAGRFLAEGAQAVRGALRWAADGGGRVHELFFTAVAAERNPELLDAARAAGVPLSEITERAAAGLSETVTPQGVVAVCDLVD